MSNNIIFFSGYRRTPVEQNQCECSGIGTGTLILSFVTGLAAGIAAALLIAKNNEKNTPVEAQDPELFI
jgi:hypothetical protein